MSTREDYPAGVPCWVDTNQPDPAGAVTVQRRFALALVASVALHALFLATMRQPNYARAGVPGPEPAPLTVRIVDNGGGKEIPEAKGQSFDGTPVDIRSDGRPKLILFVAHWCPHCQREVPLLAKYLKSNPLPKGVDLYTVSTSVVKERGNYPPSAWLDKQGWTAPTLADSDDEKTAAAFGLPGFPYFVAVDGSGKVVARTSGEITTDDFADLATKALGNR